MKAIKIMESYLERVNNDAFQDVNAQIVKKIASGESTSTDYISVYFSDDDYSVVSEFGNVLKRYYELQGFKVDLTIYDSHISIKVLI